MLSFKFHCNKVFLCIIAIRAQFTMPAKMYTGTLKVKAAELDLDLSLLGGQSFRWERVEVPTGHQEWRGIACDAYWTLTQTPEAIAYKVVPIPSSWPSGKTTSAAATSKHFTALLQRYFRLDFDLPTRVEEWKRAHPHFAVIAPHLRAVRVLDQEPFENIISFMCSQNNNIKRISTMINWLASEYGTLIGQFDGRDVHTFPTLAALSGVQDLEAVLREAKFGYRAKFIAATVKELQQRGGNKWLAQLRSLPYAEARNALTTLPGIGMKVADCICLMSLQHLAAVPIDTHIYKIAKRDYMPVELAAVKSVTPKVYNDISGHFQQVYGEYAGWAQAVLFCSGLQQFQPANEKAPPLSAAAASPSKPKKRKGSKK